MTTMHMRLLFGFMLFIASAWVLAENNESVAHTEIPKTWIDKDTGHKVVRLSEEPDSRSLYFHQNAYTHDGDKLVISVENPRGIAVVDLRSFEVKRIYESPTANILFVGPRKRLVYFTEIADYEGQRIENEMQKPTKILTVDVDTQKVREVAIIPRGKIHSINANEKYLLGAFAEREHNMESGPRDKRFEANYQALGPDGKPLSFAEAKEVRINERLEARIPMEMFIVDIKTGKQKTILRSTDWLNHLQFSPTDPELIMYCHEGPWHKVDRIWTMNIFGKQQQKIHTRSMNMEIAGHEFFSANGKQIYYDLQTPRGEVFWLASYDLQSGERVWRHLERNYWSVHFNISRDGKMFAGDGGDNEMVARAKDGKWIYLFESEAIQDVAGISAPNAKDLVRPAVLKATRLVNMQNHDYRLEPNVTFTPDGKWVVFRSNMHGPVHVYAVSVTPDQSKANF